MDLPKFLHTVAMSLPSIQPSGTFGVGPVMSPTMTIIM